MMIGIPKTEKIWVRHLTSDGNIYYITSKEKDRTYYFIYKVEDGKAVKLGKSQSPVDLESKYIDKKK